MRKLLSSVLVCVALAGCRSGDSDEGDASTTAPDPGPMGSEAGAEGDASTDLCELADERGFFDTCPMCPAEQCVSFSKQGQARHACFCEEDEDCPCGFACGCYEIAPSVPLCQVCLPVP